MNTIIFLLTLRQDLIDLVKSACLNAGPSIDLFTFFQEADMLAARADYQPVIVIIDLTDLTTAIHDCGRVYWQFRESLLVTILQHDPSSIQKAAMIEAGARNILYRPSQGDMKAEIERLLQLANQS